MSCCSSTWYWAAALNCTRTQCHARLRYSSSSSSSLLVHLHRVAEKVGHFYFYLDKIGPFSYFFTVKFRKGLHAALSYKKCSTIQLCSTVNSVHFKVMQRRLIARKCSQRRLFLCLSRLHILIYHVCLKCLPSAHVSGTPHWSIDTSILCQTFIFMTVTHLTNYPNNVRWRQCQEEK